MVSHGKSSIYIGVTPCYEMFRFTAVPIVDIFPNDELGHIDV